MLKLICFFGGGIFAADALDLNSRISNDSELKKIIGEHLSECPDETIKHGALIFPMFMEGLERFDARLLVEVKESFSLGMLPSDPLKEEQGKVPCLEDDSRSHSYDPSSGSPNKSCSPVNLVTQSFSALQTVLDADDPLAKIKILPVFISDTKNKREWVEQSILVLNYLMNRENIKVISLVFDCPLLFADLSDNRDLLDKWMKTIKEITDNGKLLVMGAGDDRAIFGQSHQFSEFETFLEGACLKNKLILVGATYQKSAREIISLESRQAGTLKQYYMVAPGKDEESATIRGGKTSVMSKSDRFYKEQGVTHFSASLVTAALLSLINQYPLLTVEEIGALLFEGAQKAFDTSHVSVFQNCYGHGILDMDSARLLCHEKSEIKRKYQEEEKRYEDKMKLKYQCSQCWGTVYNSRDGIHQFWLPRGKTLDTLEEKDETIYFPSSISPNNLFSDALKPNCVQVFSLAKSDVSTRSLGFFGIHDSIPQGIWEIISGVAVGYRYYDEEKDISVNVYPVAQRA